MAENKELSNVEKSPVVGKVTAGRLNNALASNQDTFNTLIEQVKQSNKVEVEQSANDLEDSKRQKEQLNKVIKNLEDLNKAFKKLKNQESKNAGSDAVVASKGLPKAAENLTLTEKLKTAVGGIKGVGSRFMKAGGDVVGSVTDAITNPGSAIKQAFNSSKSVLGGALGTAKDILSTKSDYTVEKERFAEAYARSAKGSQYQKGGKGSLEVGREAYQNIQSTEKEIKDVEERMKLQTSQGFEPLKKDKEQLTKLQKQLSGVDPRVEKGSTKQTADSVGSGGGSPATGGQSNDVLDELKTNNTTLASLLSVTQTQLASINIIKEALAPSTPKDLVEQKSTPTPEAAAAGEAGSPFRMPGIDINSRPTVAVPPGGPSGDKSAPKKGSLGKRILGGLGKVARVLGPAAAIAGAAYSGFEGYQNTGANFDIEEGKEATTGQKISSTLGGVASGLTFGLLDEKDASQGIHKAGSAIGDFFGFGDKSSSIKPSSTPTPGATVAQTSTENADMEREAGSRGGAGGTIVSNNVSSNNTTKYVPMKASPRPEYTGSALDRYTSRITSY